MPLLPPLQRRLRRTPRWIVALVAAIAAVGLALVPALTQPERVQLKVLIQALERQQMLDSGIVADFERANPDIELKLVEAPNNTDQVEDLYTTSFLLGDSPYDLVYMDVIWTPKFAAAGWLRDLSDRVSDRELDRFLDGDIRAGRYNGKLYRLPVRSDAGMLYYRTDLLQAIDADPPQTFAQLQQTAQQLQAQTPVEWGYLWQGKQSESLSAMFVEVLAGFGGFWVDPDTLEVGLDAPEAIAAARFLRQTVTIDITPPGVTTYAEPETHRLFLNGQSAFMRNWPYAFGLAQGSAVEGQFAIRPMVHRPGEQGGACQGGWGFGIARSTDHPEAAWRAVEYFSRAQTQKQYVRQTGYVPSRRALFEDPELVAEYGYLPDLLPVLQNAVLRPPIAQYAQASDILQRHLSAALTGSRSPQAAMENAARETRALLQ